MNYLFITSTPISANPRLRKELTWYSHQNMLCTVVYVSHNSGWTIQLDRDFQHNYPHITFVAVKPNTNNKAFHILQKLIQKTLHIIPFLACTSTLRQLSSNPLAFKIYWKAEDLMKTQQFDRIIAHNLGAFFAGRLLAKKYTIPLQLDVEDYHPGEKAYFNVKNEPVYRIEQMNLAFQQASFISFASEGIQEISNRELILKSASIQQVINNGFSKTEFKLPHKNSGKLKVVWFSQHISHSRGLEPLLYQIHELEEFEMEIHLIGNPNPTFLQQFNLPAWVVIHQPMEQQFLHAFLATMDIGLALENNEADLNRQVCLTNKIVAYAQAGLYIIATNTLGQVKFMQQLNAEGGVLIHSQDSIIRTLQTLTHDLFSGSLKQKRFEQGKQFSWEVESEKLRSFV